MGPLNDRIKERMRSQQGDIKYEIKWNTLAEYLRYLEQRGVSCNVASFIGATTIREHVIGLEDKQPTPEQLEQMRQLVRQEMEAGALGIGTSLIYPPAFYAKTEELIELCKVAAKYQGKYISHMRSEGNRLLEAIDELLRISKEANIPAEIYHIKAAGQPNWGKADAMLAKIEEARKAGLKITADMYTYIAAGTGLGEAVSDQTTALAGHRRARCSRHCPHRAGADFMPGDTSAMPAEAPATVLQIRSRTVRKRLWEPCSAACRLATTGSSDPGFFLELKATFPFRIS
jgi:N-acyl-D-aspartate/D-glutamate deacylase